MWKKRKRTPMAQTRPVYEKRMASAAPFEREKVPISFATELSTRTFTAPVSKFAMMKRTRPLLFSASMMTDPAASATDRARSSLPDGADAGGTGGSSMGEPEGVVWFANPAANDVPSSESRGPSSRANVDSRRAGECDRRRVVDKLLGSSSRRIAGRLPFVRPWLCLLDAIVADEDDAVIGAEEADADEVGDERSTSSVLRSRGRPRLPFARPVGGEGLDERGDVGSFPFSEVEVDVEGVADGKEARAVKALDDEEEGNADDAGSSAVSSLGWFPRREKEAGSCSLGTGGGMRSGEALRVVGACSASGTSSSVETTTRSMVRVTRTWEMLKATTHRT